MSLDSMSGCWIFAIAAALLVTTAHIPRARADVPEPLPTATLLSTSGASPADAALDSEIHASLERLGVVTVAVRPGLDLRAVQLAIGCTGESARCLRAVAAQSDVRILVAPSIERDGEELVLTLLYFDSRNERDLRHVVRKQNGSELAAETLDAIPAMLRELFRIPSRRAEIAGGSELGSTQRETTRPLLAGPLLLCGTGLLAIGGGAVVGLLMQSSEQDYQTLRVRTPADVDTAVHKRSLAKTEAVVANVLYGVGAGAIAIGGIWLAIALSRGHSEPAPQTAILPALGPGQLGLVLVQHGPSL